MLPFPIRPLLLSSFAAAHFGVLRPALWRALWAHPLPLPLPDGNEGSDVIEDSVRHDARRKRLSVSLTILHRGTGGEDLAQPLQNLAINGAAVAVLGFLLRRDLQASERDKVTVRREEALARLQARTRWLMPTASAASLQSHE